MFNYDQLTSSSTILSGAENAFVLPMAAEPYDFFLFYGANLVTSGRSGTFRFFCNGGSGIN